MKRLFDHDPMTGITKYWHVTDTGQYVVESVQDVSKIFEANKRAANNTSGKYGDMPRVAQIPLIVYYELKRKGILNDPVEMRKWLNKPENAMFRTREGKL